MLCCFKYRNRLGTYLDGELNQQESEAIARHLAKCVTCQAALQEIRRLGPALLTLDAPPSPPDLTARILAEARGRKIVFTPERSSFSRKLWPPHRWLEDLSVPMRIAACAMVLLAFLLGVTMGREVSLSGKPRVVASSEESLEGFEWFSPTPPRSLGSAYLTMASASLEMGGVPR